MYIGRLLRLPMSMLEGLLHLVRDGMANELTANSNLRVMPNVVYPFSYPGAMAFFDDRTTQTTILQK